MSVYIYTNVCVNGDTKICVAGKVADGGQCTHRRHLFVVQRRLVIGVRHLRTDRPSGRCRLSAHLPEPGTEYGLFKPGAFGIRILKHAPSSVIPLLAPTWPPHATQRSPTLRIAHRSRMHPQAPAPIICDDLAASEQRSPASTDLSPPGSTPEQTG